MTKDKARSGKRSQRGRPERRGRGLVSVLLGTLLLAVLGFGLGIAAGLVLEEPKLLLDYLTGRTTSAPLERARAERDRAISEPTPLADARAPQSVPDASPPPAPAPETTRPVAEPEPEEALGAVPTPSVAAPPPPEPRAAESAPAVAPQIEKQTAAASTAAATLRSGGYAVQVAALADSASAEQMAEKLRKRGFSVYVAPSAEAGSKRWRVRVGPVATREEAQALAARLESEKFPTWVLAEGPR